MQLKNENIFSRKQEKMKRASLADNVKAAAAEDTPPSARMPAPSNDGPALAKGKRGTSREGRKAVYAWKDSAEHLDLRRLSLDTGCTIDALVTEAVQDLFIKHGVKTSKQVSRK